MKLFASWSVLMALMFMNSPAAASSSALCFRTSDFIKAGAVLNEDNAEAVACHDDEPIMLRVESKDGLFIALNDLDTATYLGSIKLAPARTITAGAKLLFVTTDGPVRIEREVLALEAARPGQRLFVQGSDGRPFVVVYRPVTSAGG